MLTGLDRLPQSRLPEAFLLCHYVQGYLSYVSFCQKLWDKGTLTLVCAHFYVVPAAKFV